MRISYNWLKEFIDLEVSVDELTQDMTQLGMEVESVDQPGKEVQGVVVGQVLEITPHPNADKLTVCKTDVGGEAPLQIICGAKNFAVGDKVPTAVVGSTLPGDFKITARKMRGLESQGMMCSARELALGEDHEGLLILPENMPLGEDVQPLLGLDDSIIEIEVTPNRGDWAGMIGVARELAAYYDTSVKLANVDIKEAPYSAQSLSSVTIEDPDLCPRYCGRVLKNVTIGPSPLWLAKCLIAAGQRPINNIVDITNYVLLETGHPLHAFDLDKLGEGRIVVRRATAGETITTIDQEKRPLDTDMLMIADASNPVAVAGVMGGFESEVTEGTTNIFLESAYFNPKSIRKTARALNMITEASQRFQRGADPEGLVYAMERATHLMQELAGAEVASGYFDEYPGKAKPIEITLRFERTARLLGLDIPGAEQAGSLGRMGFEIQEQDDAQCTVTVPTWRPDVSMEADLIEDVARFYGYDKMPARIPRVRRGEEVLAPEDKALRALRRHLAGLGLTEFMTLAFVSEVEVEHAGLGLDSSDIARLQNPLSENQAVMRPSLIPSLLSAASRNIRHGNADIQAFEIAPVYRDGSGEEAPIQQTHIAFVLSGSAEPLHWSRTPRSVDFYDLKGYVETMFDILNIGETTLKDSNQATYQPGQAAEIHYEGKSIGSMGEVAAPVRKALDLENPVFVAEINLDPLMSHFNDIHHFTPIPAFPVSTRDIAVVVDNGIPAETLLKTVQDAGGKYLKQAELIDIYWGKQIPAGKKSVAIGLTYQSPERTLTDKDTEKSWKKILQALEKKCNATLR